MKKYILSQQEDYVKVDTSYSITNEGLSIIFVIQTSCDEVINITKISQQFMQFIYENFSKFFNENEFRSKYSTPVIIGCGQKLKLYMCYTSEYSEQLFDKICKIGIQEMKNV